MTGMSTPAATGHGTTEAAAAIRGLAEHWGLLLAYGLVTLGLGIALLVWPEVSLAVFVVILAIQLIVAGVFRIVQALSGDGFRALVGLSGGIALIVGLLILRDPLESVLVLTMILGAFWLIAGVIDVMSAFIGVDRPGRGGELVAGVLSIVVGGILLVYTDLSVQVLVVVTSLWLILAGAIATWAAYRLRAARMDAWEER
jgi:uncharacterized membrane protein HdeD (DUF308 family)